MPFSFEVKIKDEEKTINKIEEYFSKEEDGKFDKEKMTFSGGGFKGQYGILKKKNAKGEEETFAKISILDKPWKYPEVVVEMAITKFITS